MSDAFIGEIRFFAFNWVPYNWAACDGTVVSIRQFQALYAIIGNTFGGSLPNTFALPNLQGRVVMGAGTGPGLTTRVWGASPGTSTVALKAANLPVHSHTLQVAKPFGDTAVPGPTVIPSSATIPPGNTVNLARFVTYSATTPPITPMAPMAPQMVGFTGNDQAHQNVQPVLGMLACIATTGVFPVRP